MREIKFRAWIKSLEVMADVLTIDFEDETVVLKGYKRDTIASFDQIILLQYTGLKDENGVEIYEGDIIVWEYSEKPQEVFWDNSICGFSTKHYHLWRTVKKVKVIGNIYENKEEK